jgi:hypothetical protein
MTQQGEMLIAQSNNMNQRAGSLKRRQAFNKAKNTN